MPTSAEHIVRWRNNLQFIKLFDLNRTPYLDWVVTGYFYSALHLLDALLYDQDQIDPPDHTARRELVKNKWYLRGIKNEYFALKDFSEDARYRLITFNKPKLENRVIPLYSNIAQHITQQLSHLLK